MFSIAISEITILCTSNTLVGVGVSGVGIVNGVGCGVECGVDNGVGWGVENGVGCGVDVVVITVANDAEEVEEEAEEVGVIVVVPVMFADWRRDEAVGVVEGFATVLDAELFAWQAL